MAASFLLLALEWGRVSNLPSTFLLGDVPEHVSFCMMMMDGTESEVEDGVCIWDCERLVNSCAGLDLMGGINEL